MSTERNIPLMELNDITKDQFLSDIDINSTPAKIMQSAFIERAYLMVCDEYKAGSAIAFAVAIQVIKHIINATPKQEMKMWMQEYVVNELMETKQTN